MKFNASIHDWCKTKKIKTWQKLNFSSEGINFRLFWFCFQHAYCFRRFASVKKRTEICTVKILIQLLTVVHFYRHTCSYLVLLTILVFPPNILVTFLCFHLVSFISSYANPIIWYFLFSQEQTCKCRSTTLDNQTVLIKNRIFLMKSISCANTSAKSKNSAISDIVCSSEGGG